MAGLLLNGSSLIRKPKTTRIYGVEWNFTNPSTQLTRLDEAAGLGDPKPAVGNVEGSSPFDDLYPWSEMQEFNIIDDRVSYKKGDPLFSRTNYDTVVRIPKFWYKATLGSTTLQIRIATGEADGFKLFPRFQGSDGSVKDYIYVGKYDTGIGYVSKSNVAPLVNITRATYRTNAAAKGGNWWGFDIGTYMALCTLYLVEFADWDSQGKIGQGNSSTSAALNSGGTDAMIYHTGRAMGADGQVAIQYRGIENLWGNVWQFVDGINFNGNIPWFCLDPSKWADNTVTNYTQLGYNIMQTSGQAGYAKAVGVDPNNDWLILPTTGGGSQTTYIPDGVWSNTGWRIFIVGGDWGNGLNVGLFARDSHHDSSGAIASFGGRLLYLP